MAAKRWALESEDSLDLLLDTICNIFGGIILMAILVVLQTSVSAGRIPELDPAERASADEARKLRFDQARLAKKVADLRQQKEDLENAVRSHTTPDTRELAAARDRLQAEADRLDKQLAGIRAEIARLRQSATDAAAATQQALAAAQKQNESVAPPPPPVPVEKPKEVVLPRRTGHAGGQACLFVLRGNKAYSFSKIERTGTFQLGDCMATVTAMGALVKAELTPMAGRGALVDGADQGKGPFMQALRASPPSAHYLVLLVYDDSPSFEAFQQARTGVIRAGYHYLIGLKTNPGEAFEIVGLSGGGGGPPKVDF